MNKQSSNNSGKRPRKTTMLQATPLVILITISALLTGCDIFGGNSSNNKTDVRGVLLSPESAGQTVARLQAYSKGNDLSMAKSANDDNCPGDVPGGYVRLAGVEVEFLDENGNQLYETLTTDGCGIFAGSVPGDAARIRAEPEGLRPIEAEVEVFTGSGDPAIVSTISNTAVYQIRSLFRQSDGRFGFTVADSESGRPVIGIPASNFTFEVEGSEVSLESIVVAAQAQEAAAVTLALDVSWSMHSRVFQDENEDNFMRYHLSRDGAHLFLDEKGSNDETAIVYFDGTVRPVTDNYLAEHFTFEDSEGTEVEVQFSGSGFTSNADDLRLVVDATSPYNKLYQNPISVCTEHVPCTNSALSDGDYGHPGIQRAPHPGTPELSITSNPLTPDGTAVWDAVSYSLDAISEQPLARKAVVTLGDGGDNASWASLQETIEKANDLSIPVYTIGLGVGAFDPAAEDDLRRLGEETGGDFLSVDDEGAETELLRVFESIQTGIVFQYLATLANNGDVQPGNTVTLRLEYNGLVAKRSFTVQ